MKSRAAKILRKLTALILSLAAACLLFTGCDVGPFEKTFEKKGMAITLNTGFYEAIRGKIYINGAEVTVRSGHPVWGKEFTAVYYSDKAAVAAMKQEFSSLEMNGQPTDMSPAEYGKRIVSQNRITATVEETDGLASFSYEEEEFACFVALYRGSDAYWMIQFVCDPGDAESFRPDFITYAKSVTL